MQYKSLSFLLLAATAVADLDNVDTETDLADLTSLAGLTSGITVPTIDIPTPPPSIVSVLVTAVPDSFYSTLENPASRSAFIHSIQDGDYPQWYKDLPGSVKSWLSTAYATGAAATAAHADATTTGGSSSATGSSGSRSGSGSGAAGSSTSEGLAAPTGAVAMSLMGAAGVLGLAIAL
ncbi:hypothetical protein BJX96DRAFT_59575 [Aspergillus floccosus]